MLHDLMRNLHLSPVVFDIVAVGGVLLFSLILGFILSRIFRHWATRTRGGWGELLFALLASLPVPLLLLAGLSIALDIFTLPRRWELVESKLLLALTIIVLFYFPAKVFMLFLGRLGRNQPSLERVTAPASFVIKALFALIAAIIILENLGIHLTAVWTTLGVGSVAVALALQDTLSNFFAGLYVLADGPVNLGDYVKLDSGQEGTVIRIGWRSTQIKTLTNNLVVVPNSTLSKAVITNFSLPEPRVSLLIQVGVVYGTDPDHVERALLGTAQDAIQGQMEGLLPDPKPVVRFSPGFGDSSLDFTLIVQVRHFTDQYPVQHELRKRILVRFQKEGIEFAFPTRTIVLDKSALPMAGGQAPGK
jgi:small-conductance mechanosensitive channel